MNAKKSKQQENNTSLQGDTLKAFTSRFVIGERALLADAKSVSI